jgi:hypothetical protein
VYLRIKFKIYFFPIYIDFKQRKSIILLSLKAISELNILLKLLNKLFVFLIEMKTSNYLVIIVNNSLSKCFTFLYVGSVQVDVKPLTRLGINASVLMCLCDARFTDF